MPYNPATGRYEYGNGFDSGFDLFGSQRNDPFDIGIDEEEIRKANEAIRQTDTELSKDNRKADRKQRLIAALPMIVAALTAKDKGDLGRVLVQFAEMSAAEKRRKEEFEESRRIREQERQARKEEREDVQSHQVGMQESELGFRREAQREEFKFRRAERVSENLFDLQKSDKEFEQDLRRMRYNTDLSKELEEIRFGYRVREQASSFEHNAELERRRTSEELASRMESQGIIPDVARSAADKITSGTPFTELSEIEQVAIDLYSEYNKAASKQERDRATLNSMLAISSMEVPIEGAEPILNPLTMKKEVPTRKLNPAEILPFVLDDPENALRSLIDTSGSPDPFDPSSTGETVGEVGRRSIYESGQKLGTGEEPEAQALREISTMIRSDVEASEFGEKLYMNYGLVGARGLLTSLPIDPKYIPIIERVLEEADAQAKQREQILKGISSQGMSGGRDPLRLLGNRN